MIILYKPTIWRKSQGYYNSSIWVYSGSTTLPPIVDRRRGVRNFGFSMRDSWRN